MSAALLHGFILAFGLILPLGAQNVFIFNQGASQPRLRGTLPAVLTAALCDTLLIVLAVLGVSIVVLSLPVLQTVIFTIGFLFLLYMGWSVWNSAPASFNQQKAAMNPKKQIMFAMSVSLLNPHAILDTIGVIGTNSLRYTGSEKAAFVIVCITVSYIWFAGLAAAGRVIGNFDKNGIFLRMLNKVSAVMIWGVALYLAKQLYDIF